MLARQHVNLGIAGTVLATVGLAAIGDHIDGPVGETLQSLRNPVGLAILTVIGAAFAIVPDFDHPGSTVSRRFGYLSRAASYLFGKLTGGHRKASHSLLFAVVCGFIGLSVELLPFEIDTPWGVVLNSTQVFSALIFSLSVAFITRLVLRGVASRRWDAPILLASIAFGVTGGLLGAMPKFGLGYAMFLGVVLHIVGDGLTPSGVPWFWPHKKNYSLNLNGKTGQERELWVTQPLLLAGAGASVYAFIIAPWTDTALTSEVAQAIFDQLPR